MTEYDIAFLDDPDESRLMFASWGTHSFKSWIRQLAIIVSASLIATLFLPCISAARAAFQMRSPPLTKPAKGKWLEELPKWYVKNHDQGTRCDSRIVPFVRYILWKYNQVAGDCHEDNRNEHSVTGEHPLGLGIDIYARNGNWDDTGKLARFVGWKPECTSDGCPNRAFRWIGWNGVKNHGDPQHVGSWAHIHISWKHSWAAFNTRADKVVVMKVARGHRKQEEEAVRNAPSIPPPAEIEPALPGPEPDAEGLDSPPLLTDPRAGEYIPADDAQRVLDTVKDIDGVVLPTSSSPDPSDVKVSEDAAQRVLEAASGIEGVVLPQAPTGKIPTPAEEADLAKQVLTTIVDIPGVVLPPPLPVAPKPPPVAVVNSTNRADGSDVGTPDPSGDDPPDPQIPPPPEQEHGDGDDDDISALPVVAVKDKKESRAKKIKRRFHTYRKLPPQGKQYLSMMRNAADKYQVEVSLVAAIVWSESQFNPDAVSPAGARGLGQQMPGTARGLGMTNPHNPKQSMEGTAKYIRQLLDRYNWDRERAVAAYNAGPGNVDRYGGIPPFAETQRYVRVVMDRYDHLRGK